MCGKLNALDIPLVYITRTRIDTVIYCDDTFLLTYKSSEKLASITTQPSILRLICFFSKILQFYQQFRELIPSTQVQVTIKYRAITLDNAERHDLVGVNTAIMDKYIRIYTHVPTQMPSPIATHCSSFALIEFYEYFPREMAIKFSVEKKTLVG